MPNNCSGCNSNVAGSIVNDSRHKIVTSPVLDLKVTFVILLTLPKFGLNDRLNWASAIGFLGCTTTF